MSTAIGGDESSAYYRLRHEARTLGTIARSFDALAASITNAYLTALTASTPQAWTALVTQSALLVQRAHELDGIVMFDADERSALDFFEAIVLENADLVDASTAIAGSIDADPTGSADGHGPHHDIGNHRQGCRRNPREQWVRRGDGAAAF